jgi:nucleoside 2-deoxyribosyltransferase
MIELQPPLFQKFEKLGPTIFLAGSIEMNAAERWQEKIVQSFKSKNVSFFNPRRDDWNNAVVQSVEDPVFREQVNWELNGIMGSDLVVFYIDPATKSPITLAELGLVVGLKKPAVVCCPDGFYRKGNVEIICDRFAIPQLNSLARLIAFIDNTINQYENHGE